MSMGFPRQEYWSGLQFPSPEDLWDTRIEPESPHYVGGFFTTREVLGIYVCVSVCVRHSVLFNSLQPHGLQLMRLLCLRNSPGKNIKVHCHSLLKRILMTQVLNSGLPHCGQILYHLSHWKPRYICRCC